MKITKIITLSLISFIVISCLQNRSSKIPEKFSDVDYKEASKLITDFKVCSDSTFILQIDMDECGESINASEILQEVSFVNLETTKNSYFGAVSKVVTFDGKIFIADYIFSKSLHVFDRVTGKHLFSLKPKGVGPNEFISLLSFAIDYNKKHIIVHDDRMSKIITFDFKGKAITSYKMNFRFNELEQLNDEEYIFHNYHRANQFWSAISNYSILIGSLNGKIVHRCVKFSDEQIKVRFTGFNSFTPIEKNYIYSNPLSNTIAEISTECIKDKYRIDFGNKNLPSNFDFNIDTRTFDRRYKTKNSKYAFIYPTGIFENEKVLFFIVYYKAKQIPVFYFKKSKKLIYGNLVEPKGMTNFTRLGNYVGKSSDGKAIFYLSSLEIDYFRKILLSNPEYSFSPTLKNLIETIDKEDNGVLFFYRFKDL